MKQIILLNFACLMALTLQAQETTNLPRTLILGGSFGLSITNNSPSPFLTTISTNGGFTLQAIETKIVSFALNPYLGSQVSDHWIIGGRGVFNITNQRIDDIRFFNSTTGTIEIVRQDRRITTFGIGAFGRYTINPENKLGVYLQSALDYMVGTEQLEIDEVEHEKEKYQSVEISLTPGVNWKLSDKFSFLASLGSLSFQKGKWEDDLSDADQDFSNFNLNLSLSAFRFGLEFRL